jgi:hypothetical protein
MNINTNVDIYGIKMYYNYGDYFKILCELRMNDIIPQEQKNEIRLVYNRLSEIEKNNLLFEIYVTSSSSNSNEVVMIWEPITLEFFLQNIGV